MTTIRQMPVVLGTDRDAEMPVLKEFIESKSGQFESVLDIGAAYSINTYAKMIRPHAKLYDGIDMKDDIESRKLLDNFYIGNASVHPLKQYDMVLSVGVIEHAGVSPDIGNHYLEQIALFARCLLLAKKYAWISFDCGLPHYYPKEWSMIDHEMLSIFEKMAKPYKVKYRFFYTEHAQGGSPWIEHDDRKLAMSVPYHDELGNQSICVMEIEK